MNSTSELIVRAEHALRTGQPRLAHLYMSNALRHIEETRIRNDRDFRTARAILRAHRMNRSISGFFNGMSEIFTEAFKPITDAIQTFNYATQSDYTLAGPSKGTA